MEIRKLFTAAEGYVTKPSSYIKGYLLFKLGYVAVSSGGYVQVKSERYPKQRPYIFRFSGNDWRTVQDGCGAKASDPLLLCKHEIAFIFERFPEIILPPNEKVVEVFQIYRKNRISSSKFDKNVWLYEKEVNITDEKLADYLWFCLFSRLFPKRPVRIKKSAIKNSFENLISEEKYLTARVKLLFSSKKEDDPLYKVFTECDGKDLNEIVLNCELQGIENTKTIIYRAFKEGLLLPKKMGEFYLKIYKNCSDLNLVL